MAPLKLTAPRFLLDRYAHAHALPCTIVLVLLPFFFFMYDSGIKTPLWGGTDGGMSWTFVSVPAGFYAALEQDIAQGLRSVRAEVLIGDLEDLFAWWARQQ